DFELRAGVAAHGVAIEKDLRAATDADGDVPGDAVGGDSSTHDCAVILVAAHRVDVDVVVRLADRHVARSRVDVDGAANDLDIDVAGSTLNRDAVARLA